MKMKTTITRRHALAASVTLPLLTVASYAQPGNATDAAWSAYEVATARCAENKRQHDAFEAALPSGRAPCMADFEDVEEWRPLNNAWHEQRAGYPDNPFDLDDDALDALCAPISAAEDAVLAESRPIYGKDDLGAGDHGLSP